MTKDNAVKKFPIYMDNIQLPEGAKKEEIVVYRVCRTGKVEPDSFLTTYEEKVKRSIQLRDIDLEDVGTYSVSCYIDEKDIKKWLKFFTKIDPGVPIVAKGITSSLCGMIQRTIERKILTSGKSHVDWWIYENSFPHKYFKEVQVL